MKTQILVGAALLAFCATPVLAQAVEEHTTVVTKSSGGAVPGAVSGAVAGALVAGPVGAVVGAVAGGAIGHSVAPPSKEVRTYVTTQDATTVSYGHKFVVGKTIDGEIVWREVPSNSHYRWAYINDQRVVIDNDTRTVVAIY